MAINAQTEQLLSLTEATSVIPGGPHISTLHRWRTRGVRGVFLETCMVGGRRFTSREAIDRFLTATAHSAPPSDNRDTPLSASKQVELNRISRELEKEGI